jgi:threonine dehydratase
LIPDEWFAEAEVRIAAHIVETPLAWDPGRRLFLKWENHQVTGSFKARGALNKILTLADWERDAGLVAVSAGNHGQGVALGARLVGASAEVFVPGHSVPSKVDAMRGLGAQVRFVDGGYGEAESAARRYASEDGKVFVSPYNDGQVIAGQGTLALEILKQVAAEQPLIKVAAWVVPVGGGGLIAACGAVLGRQRDRPRVIGVQAAASAFTHSLFHRHTQDGVQDNPTLADGLSGSVETGSVTIPMIEHLVDDVLLVTEDEIARAICFAWSVYGERIEGSAAVGLAAVLEGKVPDRPSLVIVTGGNIQPEVHQSIVANGAAEARN